MQASGPEIGSAPRVSVVVPVRDERATVLPLLESLRHQTWPADEVVIADGGSSDGTAEIAEAFDPRLVRVLRIGPAFPGRGRNAGIEAARSEWVALIDAGCEVGPAWIASLVGPLATDLDLEVVQGTFRPILETEWDYAQALALLPPRDAKTGLPPPVTVSLLIRKSLWRRVGGFREDLRAGEDLLFFEAMAKAGARAARAPGAVTSWRLAAGPGKAFRRSCLYSEHHVRAGLSRTWHRRVMAMDLAGAALLVLGLSRPGFLALVVLLFSMRVISTAWKRRANVPGPRRLGAMRLLRVAWLLVLADLSVWIGAVRTLRGPRRP